MLKINTNYPEDVSNTSSPSIDFVEYITLRMVPRKSSTPVYLPVTYNENLRCQFARRRLKQFQLYGD